MADFRPDREKITADEEQRFDEQSDAVRTFDSKRRAADQRAGEKISRDERRNHQQRMRRAGVISSGEFNDHSRCAARGGRNGRVEEAEDADRVDETGDESQNATGKIQRDERPKSERADVSSRRDDRWTTARSHRRVFRQCSSEDFRRKKRFFTGEKERKKKIEVRISTSQFVLLH